MRSGILRIEALLSGASKRYPIAVAGILGLSFRAVRQCYVVLLRFRCDSVVTCLKTFEEV